MIENIEITIDNGMIRNYEIFVFINKLKCSINGKLVDISNEDLDNFFRIIRYWKNEYAGKKSIDDLEFKVTLFSKGKEEILKGKGDYPNNFNLLMGWISNIYDREI